MFRKASVLITSLVIALSVVATSVDHAEARHRHRHRGAIIGGVALGALALGALGAYGAPRYHRSGCYRGPRQCSWVGERCYYNRFDEYVCRGGHRECWRPLYCD
jgi:hypothetical protein